MNPLYALLPTKQRRKTLLSYAIKDTFFDEFLRKVADYGLELNFSYTENFGAYTPFALSTEILDSPEKQAQFTQGFWHMAEQSAFKIKITLPTLAGPQRNAHDLIHELFHAWQDMYGLYNLPLQEQGKFPTAQDSYSDIVSIIFNEAWAQTETIRTCWAIQHKTNDARGWKGAISHPDFGDLAQQYDQDLKNGTDETIAATNTIKRWYQGKHRAFYEHHALNIHQINFKRYKEGANNPSLEDITTNLRRLRIPELLKRLPPNAQSAYLNQIDWNDALFADIKSPEVAAQVKSIEAQYGKSENTNILDIKCGGPLYIWNRLHQNDIAKSEIPAEMLQQGKTIRG